MPATKLSLADEIIDIGDEKLTYPSPFVKIRKWDEECSFSLRYPTLSKNDVVLSTGKYLWTDGLVNLAFYPKVAEAQKDDGSLEFEITFRQIPSQSYIELELESTNIEFYQQTPLNQQLDVIAHYKTRFPNITADESHIYSKGKVVSSCPDYIPNSFSLFHSSKGMWANNLSDSMKYRTGKIGSIRRPKLIDALGNVSWCMMSISHGILRIEMDSAWLATAHYPVVLDPDYGMTTTPAFPDSEYLTCGAEVFVGELGTAPANGTINAVHIYTSTLGTTVALKTGLYSTTSSKPATRLSVEGSSTVSATGAAGWRDSTTDQNQAMTSGAVYWAAFEAASADDRCYVGYDTTDGTGYEGYFDNQATLPATWTDYTYGALADKKCAIHVTYTAAGGATTITPAHISAILNKQAGKLSKINVASQSSLTLNKQAGLYNNKLNIPNTSAKLNKQTDTLFIAYNIINQALILNKQNSNLQLIVGVPNSKLTLSSQDSTLYQGSFLIIGNLVINASLQSPNSTLNIDVPNTLLNINRQNDSLQFTNTTDNAVLTLNRNDSTLTEVINLLQSTLNLNKQDSNLNRITSVPNQTLTLNSLISTLTNQINLGHTSLLINSQDSTLSFIVDIPNTTIQLSSQIETLGYTYTPANLVILTTTFIPDIVIPAGNIIITPETLKLILSLLNSSLISGQFQIGVSGRYGQSPIQDWIGVITKTSRFGATSSSDWIDGLTKSGRYGS